MGLTPVEGGTGSKMGQKEKWSFSVNPTTGSADLP